MEEVMRAQRVLLLFDLELLGESLEHLLSNIADIEIIASLPISETDLESIKKHLPDLVIIAEGDSPTEDTNLLAADILGTCPDLPVLRIKLSQNIFHIYTSQVYAANNSQLIEAIRRICLPTNKLV
jgi:DNA-binding NarL/FixJ family response regulator